MPTSALQNYKHIQQTIQCTYSKKNNLTKMKACNIKKDYNYANQINAENQTKLSIYDLGMSSSLRCTTRPLRGVT